MGIDSWTMSRKLADAQWHGAFDDLHGDARNVLPEVRERFWAHGLGLVGLTEPEQDIGRFLVRLNAAISGRNRIEVGDEALEYAFLAVQCGMHRRRAHQSPNP